MTCNSTSSREPSAAFRSLMDFPVASAASTRIVTSDRVCAAHFVRLALAFLQLQIVFRAGPVLRS